MTELQTLRRETLARLQRTPLFQRVASGDFNPNDYAGYLINVFHYAQHSPRVIAAAGARATQSHPELARYLLHHATEEIGHENWAYSDLRAMGVSEEAIRNSRPASSCFSMIAMEHYIASVWNPVAIYGWMFTLEALGDDVGHLVAQRVDGTLKLGGKGSYFLAGHGDADHDHIKEISQTIEQHMTRAEDRADMLYVARQSCDLYVGMLDDVVREGRQWL